MTRPFDGDMANDESWVDDEFAIDDELWDDDELGDDDEFAIDDELGFTTNGDSRQMFFEFEVGDH